MANIDPVLIKNFIERSRVFSNRAALRIDQREYSYARLSGDAAAISHAVLESGNASNPVAVWCSGNITTYSGILGALMASKAYLPLNPKFPDERNRLVFEKSGANLLILNAADAGAVAALFSDSPNKPTLVVDGEDSLNFLEKEGFRVLHSSGFLNRDFPFIASSRGDMAYLMFTSGSTGIPKGVPVSNGNVTAYLRNIFRMIPFVPDDRFSQMFDLTFDLSVHDLFACWLSGACLCVPGEGASLRVSKYLHENRITVWFSVPSQATLMKRMRLLKENAFPELRVSLFCGEPFPLELAGDWQKAAPHSGIWNLYGPTETTIAITAYKYDPGSGHIISKNGIVSIGKVFPGHEKLLTGEQQKRGEFALSGEQVVNGYFQDPQNTEKAFFEKDGKIWYDTGDIVEEDDSGNLFFLGRSDHEIKISGYRVNLLEIESHMKDISGKPSVVVTKLNNDASVKCLAAFIEDPENDTDPDSIMKNLHTKLPWYMVPAGIRKMEKFPLNNNMKIDRNELQRLAHEP